MKRASMITAFAIGLVLVPMGARAQGASSACPERPASDSAAKASAKQWFEQGEAQFAAGKYAQALESFQCSLGMFPHRVTIYNASQAALFAGEKRTAMLLMEQYLSIAPDGEAAEVTRRALEKLAAEMSAKEAPPPPEEAEEDVVAVAEPEGPEVAPEEPEEEKKRRVGPVPLIVSAALTAGLGAGTVVLDFKVGERFDRAEQTGDPSDRESAESLQLVERILLGATAAGVVTTGLLLLFFLSDPKEERAEDGIATRLVTPFVFDRGAGLALSKEF